MFDLPDWYLIFAVVWLCLFQIEVLRTVGVTHSQHPTDPTWLFVLLWLLCTTATVFMALVWPLFMVCSHIAMLQMKWTQESQSGDE